MDLTRVGGCKMPQGEKELNRIYPPRYFKQKHRLNWRTNIIISAIDTIFDLPRRSKIIDIGCGTGDLVAEWRKWGHEAYGIEGSHGAKPFLETHHIYFADLTNPIQSKLKEIGAGPHMFGEFALATCLEVAEHIPEKYVDILFDNICYFSNNVILSAATPGQGGIGHVNCQPYRYWKDKMKDHGYNYEDELTEKLKYMWTPWKDKPGITAYYYNIMIYKKAK